MINKENYVNYGLFVVIGAAIGFAISLIYMLNIPLLLIIGGVSGLIIGLIIYQIKAIFNR